jgi:flagella basal body P-ring formation protein FlgA
MKQAVRVPSLATQAAQAIALLACGAAGALLHPARAQPAEPAAPPMTPLLASHVQAVALDNVGAPRGARVELEVGELDPRLKLAPCQRIEPFVPPGMRLWGKSRIGLRCMAGPVAWKVYLPVTVKVFGQALVAAGPLQAGTELTVLDLRYAEVDLGSLATPAFTDASRLAGRVLTRALAAGEPLRGDALRTRQWFGAGEIVTLTALGRGFAVSSEGQALNPGVEGQPVRVRTENGRIVTGLPVGARRVEIGL